MSDGWIRARRAASVDATARLEGGSVLVLAPHPDDESIGCGLLLAAKAARGEGVAVVVATGGGKGWWAPEPRPAEPDIVSRRSAEWHRALDHLGVPGHGRHELGFADGLLGDHMDAVVAQIVRLLERVVPSQVVVTSPDDLHADHRALAAATRRAVTEWVAAGGPPPVVLAYRVYPVPGAAALARSLPSLLLRRPLGFHAPGSRAAKARAVAAHVSQRTMLTDELRSNWDSDVECYDVFDVFGPTA